ncbi:phage integrase N-terminal SAM-like domain-containing protein [Psychromonas arctica]|uniref:phage integrase N-terminal SAM-like domain-containing protein n=1 Tax=Psychromonas arctica TaxID=168275 RepID=UPI0009FFC197|nr:phage integrase N-terminal SAM-like domain-containing protein [Psychromonas arctica]
MPSPFLSAVTENMRMKHYAEKTIKAYLYWITSFIYYNQKKHPNECHDDEVAVQLYSVQRCFSRQLASFSSHCR